MDMHQEFTYSLFSPQGSAITLLMIGIPVLWGMQLLKHRDILIRISGFIMLGSALWIGLQLLGAVQP